MYETHQKEQFSNAYFLAIAAKARCNPSKQEVDDDSVDWSLSKKIIGRPKLDIQLKCTENLRLDGDSFKYPLKIKNYNDLIIEDVSVPRILVVFSVPENIDEWLSQNTENLVIRKCGYWVSLKGLSVVDNTNNVTVSIPSSNIFSVEQLNEIMDIIAEKKTL